MTPQRESGEQVQVIDWTDLAARFGDDEPIKEIVEAFFVDNPVHIESLPGAIKAGNAADV